MPFAWYLEKIYRQKKNKQTKEKKKQGTHFAKTTMENQDREYE